MTEEAHSGQTRGSRPSAGQWAIALLIVLALIASLLMVFGDNLSMQATLAVIAALWAAVVGAVLVTKYRRQADTAENRTRDLRLVYELQLEREIAARRQYESDVEASIRHEVAEQSNHELDELKAQVLALRSSLEQLLGTSLPESRIAIGLERPRELGSGLTGASYAGVADDQAAAERDFATTAPQTEDGRHAPETAAGREPVEMTEIIPVVTDDPADIEREADAGREVEAASEENREAAVEPVREAAQGPEPGPARAPRPAPQQWRPQPRPPHQGPPQRSPQQQGQPQQGQPQQRFPQPPPVPQPPQRPAPQRFPAGAQPGGHERTPFAAGAYEPPSAPFRAQQQGPTQQRPAPEQPRHPQQQGTAQGDVEPEAVDDGAHASGRPASELLSRLREAAGNGASTGGHRRRRD